MVGLVLPGCQKAGDPKKATLPLPRQSQTVDPAKPKQPIEPVNAWIGISPDNRVEFVLDRVEMGQGTMTSHAMMIAEELEVDPTRIEVSFAKADASKQSRQLNLSVTGGSSSVPRSWDVLRGAAASVRQMFLMAAAKKWGVEVADCLVRDGVISSTQQGKTQTITYGQLVTTLKSFDLPSDVKLKPSTQFKVIGKPIPRLDGRMKINGEATYGIDVKVPGLLNAVMIHPPEIGGVVRRFDAGVAKKQKGVRHVLKTPYGVAVVADKYWQALAASKLVKVEWTLDGKMDSDALQKQLERALKSDASVVGRHGRWSKLAARRDVRWVEALYNQPFLAHATMEPQNCTAHHTGSRCEVWAPTQGAGYARRVAAGAARLPMEKVTVHQTMLGGGFGRRIAQDYVAEAVDLSRRIKQPVKIIWSREDDTQHDHYRPMSAHYLKGALSAQGKLLGWFHRGASPSGTIQEGLRELIYDVPFMQAQFKRVSSEIRTGYWRSVGHSNNGFVVEGFIDELAHAAKVDPYQFRRQMLAGQKRARHVLDLVARRAKWGRASAGVYQGIAQHHSFGGYCAHVVEMTYPEGKTGPFRIQKVYCAIDCGMPINPDIIRAQIEGSVAFALSAALYEQVTFKHGQVQQGNFNSYPLLRMGEMPEVDVQIVSSVASPSGVGEPGVPSVSPALVNAIFAATGVRHRQLPLKIER